MFAVIDSTRLDRVLEGTRTLEREPRSERKRTLPTLGGIVAASTACVHARPGGRRLSSPARKTDGTWRGR